MSDKDSRNSVAPENDAACHNEVAHTQPPDEQEKIYAVGYKKPPLHSRFKKGGPSPNPKGRPKGSNSLKSDLLAELSEKVPITENGKKRNYSKQRIFVKSLVNNGIKGEIRTVSKLIELLLKLWGLDDGDTGDGDLSETDEQILSAFLQRYGDGTKG